MPRSLFPHILVAHVGESHFKGLELDDCWRVNDVNDNVNDRQVRTRAIQNQLNGSILRHEALEVAGAIPFAYV